MIKQKRVLAALMSVALVVSPLNGCLSNGTTTNVFAEVNDEVNAPGNLSIKETDAGFLLKWDSYNNASSYDVYRAKSRYGNYQKIGTVEGLSWTDESPNADRYENYYKVAVTGSSDLSKPISLEIDMFGEDMFVFSPQDDVEQIYDVVNEVYLQQASVDESGNTGTGQQFGDDRYVLAFKTGDYTGMEATHYNMSYYTQILGLGKLPTDVKITNVHVPPLLPSSNVTCNFWMGIENISIAPVGFDTTDAFFDFQWAVSQAAPARRLYVDRSARLNYMWDGWASGGYIADSVITGDLGSWTQQQYYIRNNNIKGDFYGINWNFVAQGCIGMNGTQWNSATTNFPMYDLESGFGETNWETGGKYTVLDSTDSMREKPFLYFDEDVNEYKVFVPGLRSETRGTSWSEYNMGIGKSLDISEFYIARADRDNAATINQALAEGKNIILSPGIYHAEQPINITNANTVFLGLGLATIIADNVDTAVNIADVNGVTFAGVILDAGLHSENMLVVGEEGCNVEHSSNPTVLQDVFVRVGGVHGGVASTDQAVVINSNDVIGDHFWIWRADHGDGVGWDLNTAENGVVVNGDDVTLYGLMVEHFQEYDVLWRGENGKTYFLQNEKCYDPQSQEGWMSHEGTVKGYASYKVTNNVKNHYAVGLGVYDVFINTGGASIFLENAIEVPDTEGVMIENACTVEIANGSGPIVGISHIVNGTGAEIRTGAEANGGYGRQVLLSYNNGKSKTLQDYYISGGNESGVIVEETGITPTNDPKAEKDIEKDDKTEEEESNNVATGLYADWKNNAITKPAKGQLVAAGTIEIEFGRLNGAKKYEVYVDDVLVKTFEGADADASSFLVETKNVKVSQHTTYVVATLEDGSMIYSNLRNFFISKKGMGIWQSAVDKIEETNLSWYYTWTVEELTGVDENVEFVPMVWGDYESPYGPDRQKELNWLNNGGYKDYRYLLTFNEPDYTDQSNMTPERAVELWPRFEAIRDLGIQVSSPAVAIPTTFYADTNNAYGTVGGWYGKYDELMVEAEYHDDFTAVHFYFDYPGDYIIGILEDIHERTGKPIWITEWGVAQWSQVQNFDWTGGPDEGNWQREIITNFVKEILPKLDQLDYIERYAWFPFDGSNTEKYGNGAGGLFFSTESDPLYGQMTSVGEAYAKFGNPEGYNPDVVKEDVVMNDNLAGGGSGDNGDDEEPTTGVEEPTTGEDDEEPTSEDGEESTSEEETTVEEESTVEEPTTEEETTVEEETTTDNTSTERGNVVLEKNATASTELGWSIASNAVDGNTSSRWETVHEAENPQWLLVDLAGTYYIDSFKITWETAAAAEYEFQVSMDGTSWNPVCIVTDGVSGQIREESFAEVEAKYVRVLCKSKTTGYGYSIWELEVYGQSIPANTEKPDTTIDGGIEINGYQISTTVGGMRTIYSVDSQIDGKHVVSSGVVYSLADYVPESELYVGSLNNYVKSYESTTAGVCSTDYSDSDIATSYAMTMKFAVGSAMEFNTTYRIRAYAKLSDGSYVYTDATSYTVYDIADVLYKGCEMSTNTAHNYLYTNILSVVDREYEVVGFDSKKELAVAN